ncbi:DUF305 domain-containing protein [Amycolatopsis suaedae]|uniref:DUF305 domain-containing protein n=1 Tax=Amycolatopsis suaedae TaxID=2510978 RepID=A0A4Q7IXF3_9PSEU|nr:DUF305 domain-containing protein [Amycolatopsis suaedae]RZQ59620.1 DUF305 domain-containing protein [Amycolatopsis suaedae]
MGRRVGRAAFAALPLVFLVACTDEPPAPPPDQNAAVIVPGKPGEPGTVVPSQDAAKHQQTPQPNDADVNYMTMMIPHHQQAIVMTDLVADHDAGPVVRAIAGRIAAAQGAEITVMTQWLTGYGKAPDAHAHHGDHAMPGMATPQQLDALRAARGPEFDRQFLALMITHHEGAVTMARQQLAQGVEPRAQEMAQDVITGQTAEIERMRAAQQPG